MTKPIGKSVRLSQEAFDIVEAAPGNGFNEKYEQLIFAYSKTIPTRLTYLEAIEKRIKEKQKQFETIRDLEQKVNFMTRQLAEMTSMLTGAMKIMNIVSQDIVQAKPAGDEVEIQKFKKAFKDFTN